MLASNPNPSVRSKRTKATHLPRDRNMRMKLLSVDRSTGTDGDQYGRVINLNKVLRRFCKKAVLQALQQKRRPR
jgi:hypothetical protein